MYGYNTTNKTAPLFSFIFFGERTCLFAGSCLIQKGHWPKTGKLWGQIQPVTLNSHFVSIV